MYSKIFFILITVSILCAGTSYADGVKFIRTDKNLIFAVQETAQTQSTFKVNFLPQYAGQPKSCGELTGKNKWEFIALDSGSSSEALINPNFKSTDRLQMKFCYLQDLQFITLNCEFATRDLSNNSYGMFDTKYSGSLQKQDLGHFNTLKIQFDENFKKKMIIENSCDWFLPGHKGQGSIG